jgi:hypothetical protein
MSLHHLVNGKSFWSGFHLFLSLFLGAAKTPGVALSIVLLSNQIFKYFDMNEQNAISQLQLTKEISQARQVQLAAIDQAVMRLNSAGSSKECRTIASVAIFLAFLGNRVETLISSEIRNAFRLMDELKQLPDEAQWEYRCAYTLGLAEGLNRIGTIQAKIIEQAQASLHKASILLMTEAGETFLPVTIKSDSKQDYMASIMQELNPKQGKSLGSANTMALTLSKAFLDRSVKAQDSTDLAIASIFTASRDFIMAEILALLCGYGKEAVESGVYLDDPARGATASEYHMARLIAAGIVSVMAVDLMKQDAPWLSINMN